MKLITILIMGILNTPAWADIFVIAHKDSVINALTLTELKELYLGNRKFVDKVRVLPLDQAYNEPTRQLFYSQVIKIDQSQLISHWSKLIFTGKGQSPESLLSDQSILDFVSSNPSTIGYIKKEAIDNSVKVIYQAIIN